MGIILPIAIGMIFLGFEESFIAGASLEFGSLLLSFIIYYIWIIGSFALIIYPIAALVSIKENELPATQPNPTLFRLFTVSYIFAPERSLLYQLFESTGLKGKKNPMRWSRSIIRVLAYGIIFFGLFGILQVAFPQLQVVGVPQIQVQQVTVTSSVIFGSFLPAWAENGTILFILFFLLGINAYITSKFLKDRKLQLLVFFALSIIVSSGLMALFWAGIHNIVYGSSAIALRSTLIFGYLGSVMTILFGNVFFFLIWHVMNNVFALLAQHVVLNEDIILIAAVIWLAFTIAVISIEVLVYRFRNRKNIPMTESI